MGFLTTRNVSIAGIAACVPKTIVQNSQLSLLPAEDLQKIISLTGINKRRIANPAICASDLCQTAAINLMNKLNWNSQDIEVLIFVSQTADYRLPSTSSLLQSRLNLSPDTFCLDISLGCSGYIYGLSVITSIMQNGAFKKGLLLVGDTISRVCSPKDKSTVPLFGDAGTATALSYSSTAEPMYYHFMSDGTGKDAIIIPGGGLREEFSADSLKFNDKGEGIERRNIDLVLEGMDVFSFGITKAPESVKSLLKYAELDKDYVDHFVFHQANLFMNNKIEKKLDISKLKVLSSLSEFGNTSGASIPLTIVYNSSQLKSDVKHKTFLACGFGVGLSWGSVVFKIEDAVIPDICEYE